jgi:hypothetical protein
VRYADLIIAMIATAHYCYRFHTISKMLRPSSQTRPHLGQLLPDPELPSHGYYVMRNSYKMY